MNKVSKLFATLSLAVSLVAPFAASAATGTDPNGADCLVGFGVSCISGYCGPDGKCAADPSAGGGGTYGYQTPASYGYPTPYATPTTYPTPSSGVSQFVTYQECISDGGYSQAECSVLPGSPSGGGGATTCEDLTADNYGSSLPCTYGGGSGGGGTLGSNCNWSAGSCATGLYCDDAGTCQSSSGGGGGGGGGSAGHDYASCIAIAGNDPANCAAIWTQGGTTGGTTGGGLNLNAIKPYTDNIITLINKILFPLLFAVAFITFLYGVAKKYIFSRGDETAVEEGHKLILWGVIGFVVMISLWGIVNIVTDTLGVANDNTLQHLPQTPLTP